MRSENTKICKLKISDKTDKHLSQIFDMNKLICGPGKLIFYNCGKIVEKSYKDSIMLSCRTTNLLNLFIE